jgi:hypothetical protein
LAVHEAKERRNAPTQQEESVHDIRRDERDARLQSKMNQRKLNAAEKQGPTKEQLMDLKRVQEVRDV